MPATTCNHLYRDLANIIPELERKIRIISTEQCLRSLPGCGLRAAGCGLRERAQTYQDAESRQAPAAWLKGRQELRCIPKALFNAQSGSIFRTFHSPTSFSRLLVRSSDLYVSFYPRRTPLQHEAPPWMDQLCTGCTNTLYVLSPFLIFPTHFFLGDMAHIR
uniref:Uncharacterized protein n=1 Tax=Canis lupus familiaris TaxID=9615 RepID=A0A8C0N0B4_CANLF